MERMGLLMIRRSRGGVPSELIARYVRVPRGLSYPPFCACSTAAASSRLAIDRIGSEGEPLGDEDALSIPCFQSPLSRCNRTGGVGVSEAFGRGVTAYRALKGGGKGRGAKQR